MAGYRCPRCESLVPTGVFGYLPNPTTTTCILADTWYPISGPFSNPVMDKFTLGVDAIVYAGGKKWNFEIDWHSQVEAESNGTTVTFGILKNGVLVDGASISAYCKTAGEAYAASGTCVVELKSGDAIQLAVMSDAADEDIVTNHFTTTIRRFV